MQDESFPAWLRAQVRRREWNQSDLARRLGVSTGRVSQWINGKQEPRNESLERIADLFAVDVAALMRLLGTLPPDEAPDPNDPREILARKIRRLDLRQTEPWQIEALEAMVDAWLDKQRGARLRRVAEPAPPPYDDGAERRR